MSAVFHPRAVASASAVIAALRAGLGVEDMAARGIATAGFAREVVAMLRRAGALELVLEVGK